MTTNQTRLGAIARMQANQTRHDLAKARHDKNIRDTAQMTDDERREWNKAADELLESIKPDDSEEALERARVERQKITDAVYAEEERCRKYWIKDRLEMVAARELR